MRTQEEIVDKIQERKTKGYLLDFFPSVVMDYLDFDHAKQFLDEKELAEKGEEKVREQWVQSPMADEHVISCLEDYMDFAWGKVEDHRGISAMRSVQKMEAWLWLLGRQQEVDWDNYAQYGAPILSKISIMFSLLIPDSETIRRMIQGEPCTSGCTGCGH